MIKRPLAMALALLQAVLPGAYAQHSHTRSSITGRVITSVGQPVADAGVALVPAGAGLKSGRGGKTNDEGKFSFDGLAAGVYSLLVLDQARMDFVSDEENENFGEPRLCRPGDFVEFVVKEETPGIITGRVTSRAGEPVVEAIVRAFRVRESQGRRVQSNSPFPKMFMDVQRKTDDRGIYRIWSLEPGSYIISVGGKPDPGFTLRSPDPTDFDGDAPTYYSDSPQGAPKLVTVSPGAEISGIDIQYRGGSGHTICGTFHGKPVDGLHRFDIYLTNVATGATESGYLSERNDNPGSFTFPNLPDGEYDVAAIADLYSKGHEAASRTSRVTVKGADVDGVMLEPIAFASISGRVVIDSTSEQNHKQDCQTTSAPLIEEAALVFRRVQQTIGPRDFERPYAGALDVAVDSKGNFTAPKLEPGAYRLRADLPGDIWYVSSITAPGPGSRPAPTSTIFSIKDGEHISGLTISLRTGAASLHGKIAWATDSTTPIQALRVHLVPLDPAQADNPLRFAETVAKPGGALTITHIAPGRYRLLARPAIESPDRPLAETKQGRALLHRAAQQNGVEIQLRTCQRLDDLVLRHPANR